MAADLNAGRQFERKLREQDGRTLIESRCRQCGEILLGSAMFDNILEQERQHAARCRRATPDKPSSDFE